MGVSSISVTDSRPGDGVHEGYRRRDRCPTLPPSAARQACAVGRLGASPRRSCQLPRSCSARSLESPWVGDLPGGERRELGSSASPTVRRVAPAARTDTLRLVVHSLCWHRRVAISRCPSRPQPVTGRPRLDLRQPLTLPLRGVGSSARFPRNQVTSRLPDQGQMPPSYSSSVPPRSSLESSGVPRSDALCALGHAAVVDKRPEMGAVKRMTIILREALRGLDRLSSTRTEGTWPARSTPSLFRPHEEGVDLRPVGGPSQRWARSIHFPLPTDRA